MSYRKLAVLPVLLALVGGACGSDDTADEADQLGPSVAAAVAEVKAHDFRFEPEELAIEPNTETQITFTNEGKEEHSFTVEDLDVEVEAPGGHEATITLPATEVGTYDFHCEYHPDQMTGTVVVGEELMRGEEHGEHDHFGDEKQAGPGDKTGGASKPAKHGRGGAAGGGRHSKAHLEPEAPRIGEQPAGPSTDGY